MKGRVWRRQRRGIRKAKNLVRSVLRQAAARMKGVERKGDEGIRRQWGNDNATRSRGVEGHEPVIEELEEEIGNKS